MLEAHSISVNFGAVVAVNDVRLSLKRNEVLGIVGPNGSGKSTLLNALSGLVPAVGTVEIDGEPVARRNPLRVRRAGFVRTFQTPQAFTELSCIENVMVSSPDTSLTGMVGALVNRPGMWRHERARIEAAYEALERVGLAEHATSPAAGLAYGQNRYLEIARAIAAKPLILAMDEPSAGLNQLETAELAKLILSLRDDGLSILVVDHKIGFLRSICDRMMVLSLGEVLAEGRPDAVFEDPAVIDAYLGA